MTTNLEQFQRILEAAIMVAGRPLTVADMQKLFDEQNQPDTKEIRAALEMLQASYADRGIELVEVASGYQFQAKVELSAWLCRLWEERPQRYSRAILETLALIAYRQPITRAEIEEIRGVTVSTHIVKTLQDREWIRVIGYRDTPGKPALYATTKTFLDHLNLKSLEELPALSEILDLDTQEEKFNVQLELATSPTETEQSATTDEAEVETVSAVEAEETASDTHEAETAETEIEAETEEANEETFIEASLEVDSTEEAEDIEATEEAEPTEATMNETHEEESTEAFLDTIPSQETELSETPQ